MQQIQSLKRLLNFFFFIWLLGIDPDFRIELD